MSLLSSCEPLRCDKCPFIDCYEKGACYKCKCFLNKTLNLEKECDNKTYHINCPLLDGRVVVIRVQDNHLVIGRDYQ